jgi:NTE family protein
MPHRPLSLAALAIALLVTGCAAPLERPEPSNPPRAVERPPLPSWQKPVIGLALGGGAARGFAHVGVLEVLQEQGIEPQVVVGTSVGAVVGALYAADIGVQALRLAAEHLERDDVADIGGLDRGFIRGERLQDLINGYVGNRPIEALPKSFAAVATDLRSGERVAFTAGDTGMAVRASSSVPGAFRPVRIEGREYVDGFLVSQVPVETARALGADVVIAVNVSPLPSAQDDLDSTFAVLRQSFLILSNAVAEDELRQADLVIEPDVRRVFASDFTLRDYAIAEGRRAAEQAMPKLQRLLENRRRAADSVR